MAFVRPNTFYVFNHQGKADQYRSALLLYGYREERSGLNAQILLFDNDHERIIPNFKQQIASGRSKLFIYPHAARPPVQWDGLTKLWDRTQAVFVHSEGGVDVLRAYGFEKPIHVAGWPYSPIERFQPVQNPRKILFAPIHPTSRNWLSKVDTEINKAVYEKLIYLHDRGDIQLSVRYIRGIGNNGLWPHNDVKFINGDVNLSYKDILNADVVISHQTYAYLAVALGKPTIMMSEETPPRNGGSEESYTYVSSWDKYKNILMFPYDILAVNKPMDLIEKAAASDKDVREWKNKFIGLPFNPKLVVEAIKSYK